MEQQGTQLETFQQRNLLLQEENNLFKEKIHSLERYGPSRETLFVFAAKAALVAPLQRVDVRLRRLFSRRLEDMRLEKEGMSQTLSSKEASVQRAQQQLEEKTRECGVLSRQLQQTLDDTQKEVRDPAFSASEHRRRLVTPLLFTLTLMLLVFLMRPFRSSTAPSCSKETCEI